MGGVNTESHMVGVQFEQIVKRFDGGPAVLDGVSVTIAPGELFFLLGPSGCGKTTLLRVLAGFIEPNSGRVLIGDRDVTPLPANERDTGLVFQNYALWPHMTVYENVAFGLDVRQVKGAAAKTRVMEALESVGLAALAERRIPQLSGGQQQRVALARAVVIRPQVLLLDEPLSNLDAKLRLAMRSEIRRICKTHGLTGIYVTHDQKEALSMADRMAVLNAGRIGQVGTPREVYERPTSRFVADFIGESNFIEATVLERDGADSLIVDCALGRLTASTVMTDAAKGARVWLSLRPENLQFHELDGRANSIAATLADTVYLGDLAQHALTVGDLRLQAVEIRPPERQPGEDVTVCIAPEHVVVLPHTPEG